MSAVSTLAGGFLADRVFEPTMQPKGFLANIFGGLFGTGSGAGIALFYVITAFWMMAVGIAGYFFTKLQQVEKQGSRGAGEQRGRGGRGSN